MLKGDTHDREPVLSFWIRHERSESAEGHDALLPTGWKVLHDQNTVIDAHWWHRWLVTWRRLI